jgi:hypothetical protein
MSKNNKTADTSVPDAAELALAEEEEPVSRTSINKYDPFQMKSTIDDEFAHVIG